MYTLVIAFFLANAAGGAHSFSKEVPGFKDEISCKTAGATATKDLSGDVHSGKAVVRTSCLKVS
jgi:hypothetical protein